MMAAETKNTKAFYKTEIPSDWEFIPLGEVFKLTSGKKKPNELIDEPIDENMYPVFGGNGIMGFASEFNSEGENILIGRVGEYCGITRFVDEKCWITDNALYTREFLKVVDAKYLAYKLQMEDLSRLRNKGGQPLISQGPIGIHKVSLPKSLPEQKAIARVLSTADAAIHTTEKLIAQKELRKKWLMQQLLTGKKRLPAFENASEGNKGFGGEWKKLGAGEVFKSISKKGFGDEELLSATQDRGIIPRTMLEGRVTMPSTGTGGFKLVEIGDFVISLRSFQGGLEYSYYRGLVSPAYTVLKPKKPINQEFYKQYFKSYEFIGRLATAVIGIRDGKQISYDDFYIVKIPFPSNEEQTAIAQVLQAADKEISLLKAKAEKLREQKKGLMQVLLTGKVRLKINNETK
ncbi:MAG: restriction endonuclease subunit S [Saprospiraceae bacterium]|nr:restriction endonuclease subunit S [Saprospiraceae bacterium]